MTIIDTIKAVVNGQNLTVPESESVLTQIMEGACTEAQIASLLTALKMKGETVDELTGFARVMRRKATAVTPTLGAAASLGGTGREALIDTCGTGGDVSGSFNVSTATAFVVAGAGVRVAKHGNRSASSQCGSADVVEALGIKIDLNPEEIAESIERIGIGFLHAPLLHGAMKHVAAARKQIGIRTIFNLLGPLTNPAGANAQLIGVYSPALLPMVAQVLRDLGTDRAMVVHGRDGMDELTITGPSDVTELRAGEITTRQIAPEDFGLERASLSEIRGGNASQNAQIIVEVLSGSKGARRDIVLLNAAAALMTSGKVGTMTDGIDMARESIDSGRAEKVLLRLIEFTTGARGQAPLPNL
jgi:anthranilate phosphoribosyltransferase